MSKGWHWFFIGVALTLAIVLLAAIFLAYQMPELLIDWANLRYCA